MIAPSFSSSSSSHSSSSYCCLLLIQSLISACCCSAARSLLAPAAGETPIQHPNLNLDVRPQRVELNFQIGAIGSRPPSCTNKCNSCSPCQAVQVPTPLHQNPPFSSSSPAFSSTPSSSSQGESTSASSQFFTEYSNYKPEGWKCKCGNKIFNP